MNKIIPGLALACITLSAYAQPKYEANEYDLKKVDKPYAYKSTGQQFRERMESFWKISNSQSVNFISTSDYIKFLKDFETLTYPNEKINGRLANFVSAIKAASNEYIAIDGYRNKLYHTAFPISIAIKEEWGDDVMDVALSDKWRELNEYISMMASNDNRLSDVAKVVKENYANDIAMMASNAKTCPYNIVIDKPLQKDKFDIYFCEARIANNINNLGVYPQDRLLVGPIRGYTTMKDESANLLYYLSNAQKDKGNNIHYVKFNGKSADHKAVEQLNENTEWYMYAFRNGSLYYSYMALPCSNFNTCTIKELLLTEDAKQIEEALQSVKK